MSLDINLTGVEKTSNKKTTLTDNSDTFYPSQKAVKTAVDLKVDIVAGKGLSENDFTNTLKTKLDGIQAGAEVNVNADWNATSGDAQILNKPTIPDASDFVEKSDFTSHSILAKQSGASDPVAVSIGNNEILGRKSGGGSNIEGLSVSEVKSILNYTASDVGAPSGSGTSTGTNTGDETQSSILSKLGWWRIHESTVGNNSSGTSNTISKSIQIGAITDILNIEKVTFKKTGNNSTFIGRIYLSEVDNNIGGTAILLATANTSTGPNTYLPITRIFEKIGSNISGINSTTSFLSDISVTGMTMLNTPILTTSPLYLIFTTQCNSGSDVAIFESCHIKNF
jgi:hypothetical protein